MPTLASTGTAARRFELPALNLNFGSITEGTNIPPPPDSPVQKVPTPPQTPPPATEKKEPVKELDTSSTNGNHAGTKRPADDAVPLSPAASSHQGSIRRLFSRSTLNNSFLDGQTTNGSLTVANSGRPTSQSGSSYFDERKSKRSSGWFRRITGGGDTTPKRSSILAESVPAAPPTPTFKKPVGPPPPMIPELTDLEKDEGSLGDDLFKNIK